ncbi:MAG: hypothetical protein IJ809_06350 [Clostridia bacterium]|nr:hypothetical protein [Clostridia bacterium]
MKEKKGISMVALVITIAVIIIISSTAIFEYKNVIEKARKRDLATDFYAMQQAIDDYEFIHGSLPLSSEVYISVPAVASEQFASEPGYSTGKLDVYYVDYNKLNTEKLARGMQQNGIDDRYVYSKWTDKLYYLQGETVGGTTYYTLNNELYSLLEIRTVK